ILADETRQQHDVSDDLQYERATDRAPHSTDAAAQRRAADNDRRDGLQFPHQASGGRGGAKTRHIEEHRDGHAKSLNNESNGAHLLDRNARIARHILVRSYSNDMTAI